MAEQSDEASGAPPKEGVPNVIRLGDRRSDKTGKSADWQPIELLDTMADKIRTGKIKPVGMVVIYLEDEPDPEKIAGPVWSSARFKTQDLHYALSRLLRKLEGG